MYTLNIRSLTNPLQYTALADMRESDIHVFALTETWLTPNSTCADIFYAILHGFTLLSTPRLIPDSRTSSVVGGSAALLIRELCTLLCSPIIAFKSFQMSTVTLKYSHSKLTLFNIYRPSTSPAKARDAASSSQFCDDFQTLISSMYLLHLMNFSSLVI
jgi:hypothetical protein